MTTTTDDQAAYDRGLALGEYVAKERQEGGDYDARWDFADEAKAGRFDRFRAGWDAGYEKGQGR